MYAIVTKRGVAGITVTCEEESATYEARANRYDSEQLTHADAAMRFVREHGMRIDCPKWVCGTLPNGYVFVAPVSHMVEYSADYVSEQ